MNWLLWLSLGLNVVLALAIMCILARCLGSTDRKWSRVKSLEGQLDLERLANKTLRAEVDRLKPLVKWAGR